MLRMRAVLVLVPLIFVGTLAIANSADLDVISVGTAGDVQEYRVDIGAHHLDVARATPQMFAEQVMFVYEAILERDSHLGILDGKIALLHLKVLVGAQDANFLIGDSVVRLGALARRFSERAGIRIQFRSSSPPHEDAPDVLVREPTGEDREYIEVATDLWRTIADLSQRKFGHALEGDALVSFAIREAIDDSEGPIDGTVIAVGVWLGEQLISRGNFKWANVTDEWGSELAVVFIDDNQNQPTSFFPFSAARKRLEAGIDFDARGMVNDIAKMLAK